MTHALKTWKEFYSLLEKGDKTFELRKDDRPFEVGDILLAQEYDKEKKEYSGKENPFVITFILRDAEALGLKKGYCVLGIKEKSND